MNEDLAELDVYSECGQEFTACDLEEAREERREAGEVSDDDEGEDGEAV